MLEATVFDTICEVKILARDRNEFDEDLERIKAEIDPADRRFDDGRKVWIISRFQKYAHLPYVAGAIKTRERQPTLF